MGFFEILGAIGSIATGVGGCAIGTKKIYEGSSKIYKYIEKAITEKDLLDDDDSGIEDEITED